MKTLYQRLLQDKDDARLAKTQTLLTFLSTMIGEVGRNPDKDQSDAAVTKVLLKAKEAAEFVLKHSPDNEQAKYEIKIIDGYLPKFMTNEEILDAIKDANNVGEAMKAVNAAASSLCKLVDRSLVKTLFEGR